jgi:hypothetical protein
MLEVGPFSQVICLSFLPDRPENPVGVPYGLERVEQNSRRPRDKEIEPAATLNPAKVR